MAIGAVTINPNADGQPNVESAFNAEWITVIAAGGMAVQDAATITNPTTEITDETRKLITLGDKAGHYIRLRMGYDDELTTILTDAVIRVFGRRNSDDPWQVLENQNGDKTATLTSAESSDVTDGTLKYTHCDRLLHTWDRDGCTQILIGVETVLDGTGSETNSILQLKLV